MKLRHTVTAITILATACLSAQEEKAAATAEIGAEAKTEEKAGKKTATDGAKGAAQEVELVAESEPPGTMKFKQTEIKAKAGKPIKLTFSNPDIMQHNILVLKPGTKDKVGALADAMIADPEGMKKSYIPKSPDVLHSMRLLNNGEKETMTFTIDAPGEYPVICTFPGHWRIMNAVLKVEK